MLNKLDGVLTFPYIIKLIKENLDEEEYRYNIGEIGLYHYHKYKALAFIELLELYIGSRNSKENLRDRYNYLNKILHY